MDTVQIEPTWVLFMKRPKKGISSSGIQAGRSCLKANTKHYAQYLLPAVLLLSQSSSVSYTFDATGACGPEPATGYGVIHQSVKFWDNGKTTFTYRSVVEDVADANGEVIGQARDSGMVSGHYPAPTEIEYHNTVVCKGGRPTVNYACGVHYNALGEVEVVECH
jgi:hypothetical protein